ncbi:GM17020 [Drosophila sechellia]|uniref:GM17020 n=1 Tax=Drosophila sechellia TaxID=7238 RepID=B4I5T0_DROSE|nr:GM17020 [Drosophila sechellia]
MEGRTDKLADRLADRLADGTTDGLLDCWAFFQPPNDRHFIIVSFGECQQEDEDGKEAGGEVKAASCVLVLMKLW